MERGSTSRRNWADEVEVADELTCSRSAGLNPDAEPFSLAGSGFGRGEKLSFTDSEASFGSEAPRPAAADKGKGPAVASGRRRRPRRCRRAPGAPGGFLVDTCRAYQPEEPPPAPKLRSLVVHPARLSAEPDSDGFRQVNSRCRWHRRPSPAQPKPVLADLVSLCFNCLGDDHVKANCRYPPATPAAARATGHATARSPLGRW